MRGCPRAFLIANKALLLVLPSPLRQLNSPTATASASSAVAILSSSRATANPAQPSGTPQADRQCLLSFSLEARHPLAPQLLLHPIHITSADRTPPKCVYGLTITRTITRRGASNQRPVKCSTHSVSHHHTCRRLRGRRRVGLRRRRSRRGVCRGGFWGRCGAPCRAGGRTFRLWMWPECQFWVMGGSCVQVRKAVYYTRSLTGEPGGDGCLEGTAGGACEGSVVTTTRT
jgi:hypothetical protein